MITKLSAPISVYSTYDHKTKIFTPLHILWDGKVYKTTKIGYHHTFYSGKTFLHVFSVLAQNMYFKLIYNTQNLSWQVEEISDGEID